MSRRYQLFGLTFESELELPELPVGDPQATPDVTTSRGQLAEDLPRNAGRHRISGGDDLLNVVDIARYRCRGGREMLVDAHPGVPERNVRLYLLGSAMGLLLHQRGLFPLHANAIEVNGRAHLFAGPSGVGKSTLAAWFHDHGYRVIGDDVALIRFDRERAVVEAGLPRLRLWRDAVSASGRTAEQYQRSYVGDDQWEKYDVPLGSDKLSPVPLASVFLLEDGNEERFEELTGVAAVQLFMDHTYRGGYLSDGDELQTHLATCLRLARTVPVTRWQRPKDRSAMDEQGEGLLRIITGA